MPDLVIRKPTKECLVHGENWVPDTYECPWSDRPKQRLICTACNKPVANEK